MKMDMVKEFEDLVYWLENEFVDNAMLESPTPRDVWESVMEMHLENANYALTMAKMCQDGSFTIKAEKAEAEASAKRMYAIFFEAMPEEAFMGRRDAEK